MFFTTISDESFGGSYMTFLNTLTNLGGTWPRFIIFWAADHLTCPEPSSTAATATTTADTAPAVGCAWVAPGSDGFYPIAFFCVAVGVIWLALFWRRVRALERVEHKEWLIAAADHDSDEKNARPRGQDDPLDSHPLLAAETSADN